MKANFYYLSMFQFRIECLKPRLFYKYISASLPFLLLAIFAFLPIGLLAQTSILIDPAVTAYSSQNPSGITRSATATVDGSGLTAGPSDVLGGVDSTHDNNSTPNMWTTVGTVGPGTDVNPYIIYDLGSVYDLQTTRIWNYNESSFTILGARSMLLSTSLDGTNFSTFSVISPAQAGGSKAEPAQDFTTTVPAIRYVKMQILTNWDSPPAIFWSSITGGSSGGNDGRHLTGLSEVRFMASPPRIINFQAGGQPTSVSVSADSSTQLIAHASGASPLYYQWHKGTNGVFVNCTDTGDVSGSTTNTLHFSAATASDAADYRLIVTNSFSAATSQVATVIVILVPQISAQPTTAISIAGQSSQLTATALGAPPLYYQWQKGTDGIFANCTDISEVSGSTANTLNFSAISALDAADYRLIVSNAYGFATSQVATVSVTSFPSINSQPTSATLMVGQSFQLNASAFGAPPLYYQWQKGTNGTYINCTDAGDLSGSATSILNFNAAVILDAADYRLIVSNASGSVTSQVATIKVFIPSSDNSVRMGLSYGYVTNFSDWEDAFFAGNGKMGIMVFGNPLNDTIIYNDRGLNWAASTSAPARTFAQVSASDLATIKSNCVAGNYSAADSLAGSAPQWNDGGESSRHPGYEMLISIPQDGTISNYSRVCNFRTGEVSVNWSDNRGAWSRKSFVSRQDNVTVQYLPAPSNEAITCSIQLSTDPGMNFPSGMTFTSLIATNFLNMRVKYPSGYGDAGYEGVTRVVQTGGTASINGNVLTISNAASVILLTRTAKYYTNSESQWDQQPIQSQLAALPADYGLLLNGQLATHEIIYDRSKIDYGASPSDRTLPNELLLAMQANSATPVNALWERIFDAGRYYFLSSSSSNAPPDLFGIWTGVYGPFGPANSMGYTLDANLNLQIADGNIGDMPEAMAGYFSINEGWQRDFETNASKLLGCRGILACGNTPGTTSGFEATINTTYPYQYVTGEEPWLLYPFWEHYLITGDTIFLQNKLYPLLKDMGNFYEDFLTLTDTNGNYIFAGSVSPENQPSNLPANNALVNNSTFDIAGAKLSLSTLIQTCSILGLEQGPGQGIQRWTAILNKLPPYLINADGALEEWSWPGLSDNYNHRHSSHLVTVWPYREITPESTPAFFNAAAITLAEKDVYSYENTGHGLLHSALIAAGLKDSLAVNHKILRLTREGFYYNSLCSSHYSSHGTFCTDTCNSMPGVMTEMLVSSAPGVLELLPALPQTLSQGSITDVKGRNRVTVQNLSWNITANSVDCTLRSDVDQDITLIERSGINTISTDVAVSASPLGQIARIVHLQAKTSTDISIGLGQANLALNRPVTASSGSGTASKAVDGSNSTMWSSAGDQSQWIYVDLGSIMNLNGAQLIWGSPAYGQSYNIQVSNDGINWTNVFETPNGLGGVDRITFAASCRYVRMLGVQSSSSGYSLAEFQIFGSIPASLPIITNPPVSWTNTVGSTATFAVGATDGGVPPLTYQWRFDGTNLADGGNILGSTTATLTITGVTLENSGNYSAIVGNASSSVSTSPVYLDAILVELNIFAHGGGNLITPTISVFSSYYNSPPYVRNVTNLVQNDFVSDPNQAGLSGPGYYTDTHDSGEDDVWHRASNDNNPYVTLDLGTNYNLLITRIWNLNQGQSNDNQNGTKDVRISVSASGTTFTILGTNALTEGPGGTNSEYAQDFSTPATGVRYVKLEPLNNYGGAFGPGLGAVRFVVAGAQSQPLVTAVLKGTPSFHYQLQSNATLGGTFPWQTLVDLPSLLGFSYSVPVLDGLTNNGQNRQFYRVVWMP